MGGTSALGTVSTISKLGSGIAAVIGAVGNSKSGGAARDAAYNEAALQERQGDIAVQEAYHAALQKQREVKRFEKLQTSQFNRSGVTLEGTPLSVLEETRRLGQEEIDALMRQGASTRDLYRMKANQTRNAGRAAFTGGNIKAATDLFKYVATQSSMGMFGKKANMPGNPNPVAAAMSVYGASTSPLASADPIDLGFDPDDWYSNMLGY